MQRLCDVIGKKPLPVPIRSHLTTRIPAVMGCLAFFYSCPTVAALLRRLAYMYAGAKYMFTYMSPYSGTSSCIGKLTCLILTHCGCSVDFCTASL